MSYNNKNQIIKKNKAKKEEIKPTLMIKNGNILSDTQKTYTYTAFNKVKTITQDNKTITMKYDSFDNLLYKIEDEKVSYFIDKEYEYIHTIDVKKCTKHRRI